MTVDELVAGLNRIRDENSEETRYYNSDEGMAAVNGISRAAAIRAIGADNRWITGMIAAIKEAEWFVNDNAPSGV